MDEAGGIESIRIHLCVMYLHVQAAPTSKYTPACIGCRTILMRTFSIVNGGAEAVYANPRLLPSRSSATDRGIIGNWHRRTIGKQDDWM